MFQGWFSMIERCSVCAFRFEREQGYFLAAIYLNWAATGLVVIPTCIVLSLKGVSVAYQLVLAAAICVLVPLLFFRHSKSLWLALDYFVETILEEADLARRRRSWGGHAGPVAGLATEELPNQRPRKWPHGQWPEQPEAFRRFYEDLLVMARKGVPAATIADEIRRAEPDPESRKLLLAHLRDSQNAFEANDNEEAAETLSAVIELLDEPEAT